MQLEGQEVREAAGQGGAGQTGGLCAPSVVRGDGVASFTVGTYNVRGPITVQRFMFLLQSYPQPLPSILGFTEFSLPKGSFVRQYQHAAWVTHQRWLLTSMTGQRGGVALLVDPSVLPGIEAPAFCEVLPGRILSIQCRIDAHSTLPCPTIAVVYGSCVPAERHELAQAMTPLLDSPCILMGDWNAVTELAHTSNVGAKALIWPWLQSAERSGGLVDLGRAGLAGEAPMTRCRGHPGASYLDRIYATKSLFPCLSVHSGIVGSVRGVDGQEHFSDHNFIHVAVAPWLKKEPLHPHPCASWSRKHVKLYRRLLADFALGCSADALGAEELVEGYLQLQRKMKWSMEQVNTKYPQTQATERAVGHDWQDYVRNLVRLARRNPRIFFRRVKSYHLLQMPQPVVPLPPDTLLSLLQSSQPWDPTVLDFLEHQPQQTLGPMPTDARLRQLARTPRAKRGGPDGVSPYLIYQLPDACFAVIGECVRRVLQGRLVLPDLYDASLFGVFKGKGDWAVAASWRPLCLTNAAYRLMMKACKDLLDPLVQSWIRNDQFGARKGCSCSQATLSVMDALKKSTLQSGRGYLLLIDLANAFGSTPIPLVLTLLKKLGIPLELLRLCETNFQMTRVFAQDGGQWIRPTSGLKQGCPLSPLLFILLFNACLLLCQQEAEAMAAFMDDLALVFSSFLQTGKGLDAVRGVMQRFGWIWNLSKTVLLHAGEGDAVNISVPKVLPTPDGWLFMPDSLLHSLETLIPIRAAPVASRPDRYSIGSTQHATHLGHPIDTSYRPQDAYMQVLRAVEQAVVHFHNQPIPFPERVQLVNLLLAPRALYLAECLPPWTPGLHKISDLLCDFVQGVKGLPKSLVAKTLFAKEGIGLAHLPTLIPIRVLDVVHRFVERLHPPEQGCPFSTECHRKACIALGAACVGSNIPVQRAMSQYMALPAGIGQSSLRVEGLQVFSLLSPVPWIPLSQEIYTDGSFFPEGGQAGSAVLLPDGRVYMARPPGMQGIYKAELLAVLIACSVAAVGSKIFCDSLGVLRAVQGNTYRVTYLRWIHRVRLLIHAKNLQICHIHGHAGVQGNEIVDKLAKRSCSLPLQPPQFPAGHWDVCFHGELVQSPHKTWARCLAPHHQNEGIHPISWKPLKWDPHRWVRWLFGVVDAPGFASHYTFWQQKISPKRCPLCQVFHNQAVAGALAFCPASRLGKAWEDSWGQARDIVLQWRSLALKRDRWLLGKVVIPVSLWLHLCRSQGRAGASNTILAWQKSVVVALNAALPTVERGRWGGDTRLNCWEQEGWYCWDEERAPPSLRRPR